MSKFSIFHDFPKSDIEESVRLTENQHPASRALVYVTTANRQLAIRQLKIQQIAICCIAASLVISQFYAPSVSDHEFSGWAIATVALWLTRSWLARKIYDASPMAVAKSVTLRLIPIVMVLLGCGYWLWTAKTFTGTTFGLNEAILGIGLLAISISMAGLSPVTPLAGLIFLCVVWPGYSYFLYENGVAQLPILIALMIGVAFIIWLVIFISLHQIRDQLARSDRVDLLMDQLSTANNELMNLRDDALNMLQIRKDYFRRARQDFKISLRNAKISFSDCFSAEQNQELARKQLGRELEALDIYTHDIMRFVAIDTIDSKARLASTDMEALFHALESQFKDLPQYPNVRLRFRSRPARIHTDGEMLHRMIETLIASAIKSTKSAVLVAIRKRKEGIAVEIWDQGPGTAILANDRVFDPGWLSADAAGHPSKIDIDIVDRFAHLLGYDVEVKSRPGRGSMFRILVPEGGTGGSSD